ncbi:MAG: acetyl-CoA carboxylase biotin carboxyl carrier protein [Candidatus Margulisbacteria bacterium]|nr:acetyl-CoA carboxylase biotin carboxyl carrier protein [Candidatus Margulisiibacteriota bacterium]MBU1021073.1 acetyl-CoA carboxylase biotin carboxyl carrier protein [Candidatus Margulisiibacteriota bacterium]MBU1729882.1 acetyl-CoA carboxylase biotin carboxyl carrier protein [Candidatus Margulisiibacteriota bacterium]MBU1955212.1 acetyl-CoA carboxylase biotin carboxyl carrier protein [Candidatus Margulisiibacteriota bacterium]
MDKLIDKLVEKINQHKISSISIEENGIKVEVKKGNGVSKSVSGSVHHEAPHAAPQPVVAAPIKSEDDGLLVVTSPMVGTFYRSPSPDSAPFIEVGDKINPGKTVCIVEAMKLFNEIESEISGTVEKILVENGKPVEYGQKLLLVKPN